MSQQVTLILLYSQWEQFGINLTKGQMYCILLSLIVPIFLH